MTKMPWYLRRGVRLHVLSRWRASDVLRTVAEQRVPDIGAIPAQIALMLQAPEFEELDLSCVQRIIAGGAASPPALIDAARRRFGADYVVRYSCTESGGVGLGTSADAPEEALHSIGRPRRGVQAEVRDSDGTRLPPGEVGELCLRTPSAMTGYWRDEDATRCAIVDGWLRTGDLATQEPGGTFALKGRLKEMYIRGGYNVYPAEVEAELSNHPAVVACAVVPRPDPAMGEVGVAVVTLQNPGAALSLADVRGFLDDRIARWKQPEEVVVVDELPLNGTHKIDRRALTAMVTQRTTPAGR
jgi:acyl-CoA synthetase (AMP-forming)/AMP-acid ligase II